MCLLNETVTGEKFGRICPGGSGRGGGFVAKNVNIVKTKATIPFVTMKLDFYLINRNS